MTSRLRVGVIGCGGIAQMMHLPTLEERDDLFELAAIAEIDDSTRKAVADRFHVKRAFADASDVLALSDVDAVLLLASGSHQAEALAAIAAGKHLFVEKPLGFGPSEANAIADAARSAKTVVMVGYHKRYDPAYQRARQLALELRDLRHVQVTVLHPNDNDYRRHHEILPRRAAPSLEPQKVESQIVDGILSGNMQQQIDDIAGSDAADDRRIAGFLSYQSLIHETNLVRGVLGEPQEVVSWHTWRGGLAQSSLSRFPGDVMVQLTWVQLTGLRNYEETLRFVGGDGRVTLVFPSPYLRNAPTPLTVERMDGDSHVVENHTVSYEEAFRRELCAFHDCVKNGRQPETNIEDALGDTRWIQAMLDAG